MNSDISLFCRLTFARLQENLDWADLVTVDLSLYHTPEGKKQLAKTLIDAVREKGFFYVKNFNISQERVDRQFGLGKQFYELPLDEKEKYTPEGIGGFLSVVALTQPSPCFKTKGSLMDISQPDEGCMTISSRFLFCSLLTYSNQHQS